MSCFIVAPLVAKGIDPRTAADTPAALEMVANSGISTHVLRRRGAQRINMGFTNAEHVATTIHEIGGKD